MTRGIGLVLLVLLAGGGLGRLEAQVSSQAYFWDDPQYLVRQGARFPTAVDNGKTAAAFWQERRQTEGWPQTFLSLTVRNAGDTAWTTRRNVLGPFTLVGAEAKIYTALVTPSGVFWVAVLTEQNEVTLYKSTDGAATFQEDKRMKGKGNLLVPRLFLGPGDEPLLMVNQADEATFRIFSSRRVGGQWTDLVVVTDEANQRQSFQPSLVRVGNHLTVVYQTLFTAQRITYQIYRKDSSDGGATWGPAQRLSDFGDDIADNPDQADNQRPEAYWFQNRLFVAWERRTAQSQPAIEAAVFSADGRRLDNQLLTQTGFTARNPLFYTFRETLRIAWFDNRNETYDLFLSSWDSATGWDTPERLTKETGNSVFGQPARLGNDLYFFWQNTFGDNPGVVMLQPDRRVDSATLSPVNFKLGTKTNKPDFVVDVVFPRDVSGIQGFNSVLTRDPSAEPAHERRYLPADREFTARVSGEGLWYLAVTVEDGAGNWSAASRIPLNLKTTPPGPVLFDIPETDARGYLTSNTFRLSWKPTSADTASYVWKLTRVGDALTQTLLAGLKAPELSLSPSGTETFTGGDNFEDGLWALAVAAFDEAGNRGPVSTQYFRMNKFRPYTLIEFVDIQQDAFGRAQITIHGRGFTAGGSIDHVYIDRDGAPPFDYDLGPARFHLASDRLIDGIRVEGLAEGTYRIGVNHPDRGRVFTDLILKVGPTGTVKIGDYRNVEETTWEFFQGVTVFFSVNAVYFWAIMALLGLIGLGSGRLLAVAMAERAQIDRQAMAWFADTKDKWARRARGVLMKTKGRSLTFKFAASILGLTGTVILMLALTLGFFITENSQRTLGTALQQRTQVLLESLASGARTYLPTANYQELGNLPQQISAMEGDALYATITGPSSEKKAGLSYVYASNDPNLKTKSDTPSLIPGVTVLRDPVEAAWIVLQKDLERQAEAAVGDTARQIESLSRQALPLAAKTDAASRAQVKQFDDQISGLKRQVIAKLAEIGGKARSYPTFDTQNLLGSKNKQYLFYQPFLYQALNDSTYVRGLVRVEVSSQKIEQQITASRDQLIFVTLIVALIALGLGLVGALILSAITINPIRKLVSGVEVIRDTDDKTHLDGHVIDVQTRDELEDLASTVNEMTHSLVKGAKQSKEMAGAKGLQKTYFISLDKDSAGNKLTTFGRDLDGVEVFAYYEGAKTVSGDLYEFRQLDTREGKNPKSPWYGIMKGDISGKGVEALLAMTIAAAFVTNFFRRWTEAKDGRNTKIDGILNTINDNLEPILAETGAQKFAALNIGILNTLSGELQFSQAGDNLLHLWRAASADKPSHFELLHLEKTAPAGLDSSQYHIIRYRNQKLQLHPGDTLLYFTDGIEESQCAYRDAAWQPVAYFDPSDASTVSAPGTRRMVPVFEGGPLREVQAQETEDFNPDRMEAIIEAYQHRQVYQLVKQNWFHPEVVYHFDFGSCDGSAKGLVLALISIDRIFRLVPDPSATEFDTIDLDLVQDDFLRKHFVEFGKYFKNGYLTFRQAVPQKENMDADGYFLSGAVPIPVWQKGDTSKGETVDDQGYRLVDGERVPAWERARKNSKDARDAEGYRLVEGQRVRQWVKGNRSKGDSISPEGHKLEGGSRELSNPGYIRYSHLREDPQFDDLTLLAIRKK